MVGTRSLSLAILTLALLPASAAATPTTQIIVKREAGLSAAERADLRADADVRFVETLPLPRTEVVAAQPGEVSDALRDLNADPDVVYAERDRTIRASSDDPDFYLLWGLENRGDRDFEGIDEVVDADTDAPDAWLNSTGSGQTVAVVDSGVALTHPDLQAKLLPGLDYVDGDTVPQDLNGHGTHVTGTIAAVKDNDDGVVGIAPDANALPLRVLDEDGRGFVSDAILAYDYAGTSNVRIVNASLGGVGAIQTERDAIEQNSDVLFVVAAGNGGDDGIGDDNDNPAVAEYPCSYNLPNVLCVGASRPDDQRAGFSNYGATAVDLFAPGYGIYSTWLNSGYHWSSGTSMATPHVAGAAALVRAADPDLTPAQVKAVLMQSGDYKAGLGGLSVTGRRLNADAAVRLALAGGPQPDSDGDGFPDTGDACPGVPGSKLPNGCPDRDADGVTDGSDNCPSASNPGQADADADRVGDACDATPRGHDNDHDGKPAIDDACPTVYGTLADGCPAPSNRDGDNRVDADDACPTEYAISNDGCPVAQVTALSARVKKRSATVSVSTSRAATVQITVERRKGGGWVRVTRKTRATVGNRVSLTVTRLKRGAHRVKVTISSSGGAGSPRTKSFRVR
jgi:subtilisin family serine protease